MVKVASDTIKALRSSPALLVLVLLQCTTMVMIYLAGQATQSRGQERELAILNRCFPKE